MIHKAYCDVLKIKADYVVQQVNCLGIAGAGLAKQIREQVPGWYENYKAFCEEVPWDLLECVFVYKNIISIFSQRNIGTDKQQTIYSAMEVCFHKIADKFPKTTTFAIPYGIGCGLAGGNWETVEEIIQRTLGKTHEVFICKYNK